MRTLQASTLPLLAAAWTCSACGGGGSGAGGASSTSSSSSTTSSASSSSTTSASASSSSGAGGGTSVPFTSKGASLYEAQTTLAADASGDVVAAWIAFAATGPSSIGYSVTHDGGSVWSAPRYVASPGGRYASNPVLVVDSQKRFTLAWIGFGLSGAMPDEHVYVARLDAATGDFLAPAIASDDGTSSALNFDKPSLAVDANDDLLVTWADFTTTPTLTFARSADATTFTRTTVAADATFGNLASLCLDTSAGPSAEIYMVHLGPNGTVSLRTSTSQGASFTLHPPLPTTSVIFSDPTCVVHGSEVTIAYGVGTALFDPTKSSPATAIAVVRSHDGGTTFDAPLPVAAQPGVQYLYPRLGRAPNGKLEITFYSGTDGAPATFAHASSADGITWTVSPIGPAGTFTLDRTLASWLGDYTGLGTPGASSAFVSFTENSEGKAHVKLAEIALP
jgi:hypothetical protein